MTPLVISEKIPFLYENAMVIGYPMGGDNVCVTRGVVSRVTTLPYEDTKFFLPNQELIAIQLDAAINSGNSVSIARHDSSMHDSPPSPHGSESWLSLTQSDLQKNHTQHSTRLLEFG